MSRRADISHATPLVDVRLSVDRTMPTQARRVADGALGDLEGAIRYNFLLLVSELVANAVLHSHSPKPLRVLRAGDRLRVEVYDGSPAAPVVLSPSPYRTHGRGMLLVDGFATDWGVRATPTGKVVWAEITTGATPGPPAATAAEG